MMNDHNPQLRQKRREVCGAVSQALIQLDTGSTVRKSQASPKARTGSGTHMPMYLSIAILSIWILQFPVFAAEQEASPSEKDTVPLAIEFPRPASSSYTGGSPKKANFAPGTHGYEKPSTVMVPKEVRNLAIGARVISSSEEPAAGSLRMITDGDKSGERNTLVELGPERRQWIQVDLGREVEVFAVAIWRHPRAEAPHVYRDMVVLLSSDEKMVDGTHCIFNNDNDNSLGLGRGEDFEYCDGSMGKIVSCVDANHQGIRARYIRIWTNGHLAGADVEIEMTAYSEVEVWGRPVSAKMSPSSIKPLGQ